MSNIEVTSVKNVYEWCARLFGKTRHTIWPQVVDFIEYDCDAIKYDHETSKSIAFLDVGCGSGANLEYAMSKLNSGINSNIFKGIDNCEEFIEICREKKLTVENRDICELNEPDNFYDRVICIAVFHHLSTIDRRIIFLNKISNLLKKDSKFLMSVWALENYVVKKTDSISENGDAMIAFTIGKEKKFRYYHLFSEFELENLINVHKINLKIVSKILEKQNYFYVLTKKN